MAFSVSKHVKLLGNGFLQLCRLRERRTNYTIFDSMPYSHYLRIYSACYIIGQCRPKMDIRYLSKRNLYLFAMRDVALAFLES